jgi:hypothetical protein
MPITSDPERRWRSARRWFWVLTLVAMAATGSLSTALAAPPGARAGLRVASSGLVLIAAVTLAARVMVALERAHRGGR